MGNPLYSILREGKWFLCEFISVFDENWSKNRQFSSFLGRIEPKSSIHNFENKIVEFYSFSHFEKLKRRFFVSPPTISRDCKELSLTADLFSTPPQDFWPTFATLPRPTRWQTVPDCKDFLSYVLRRCRFSTSGFRIVKAPTDCGTLA